MQLSDRIGRRMKLQDLHVLMTVVQAGSMGKAADQLSVSQPAISKAIADMETFAQLGPNALVSDHREGFSRHHQVRASMQASPSGLAIVQLETRSGNTGRPMSRRPSRQRAAL